MKHRTWIKAEEEVKKKMRADGELEGERTKKEEWKTIMKRKENRMSKTKSVKKIYTYNTTRMWDSIEKNKGNKLV